MIDIKNLATEKRNERSMNLDQLNAKEIATLINQEDRYITEAIENSLAEISTVIEVAAETIRNGGRVIYLGAGTSGRLGILDAVECPPTYGVDFNTFVGLIAGGESAFIKAVEGAEDSKELAIEDLKSINVTEKDFVFGIAASGRTPYVIAAIEYGKSLGCKTGALAITNNSPVGNAADYPIEVVVGPEVVTGSTRMKAGTAQKMVLNMISTGAMVLNGKVYQNLMVDVMQTNEKLVQRAKNMVCDATGCTQEIAAEKLEIANGSAKIAITMILYNLSVEEATNELAKVDGFISKIEMGGN